MGAGPSRRPLVLVAAVLVAFAVVGAACGWLWEWLWEPAPGVVVDHTWYPQPWDTGQEAQFAGTGWYLTIATAAGLVLGGLAAVLVRGREVLVLVTVALGSLVAGWLMRLVGLALAPPDPQELAARLPDRAPLPSGLQLWEPATWLGFPFGALLALMLVYLLIGSAPRLPEPATAEPAATESEPAS